MQRKLYETEEEEEEFKVNEAVGTIRKSDGRAGLLRTLHLVPTHQDVLAPPPALRAAGKQSRGAGLQQPLWSQGE